jgi:Ran GTPase-activating protein (RanGAP) involved in mRNA processing and transport
MRVVACFMIVKPLNSVSLVLCQALQNIRGLTHLDLADNIFSGGAGELLANAIKNQRDLQSLNLRDAGLGPKNSALVLNALVEAQAKLTTLDFSGDNLPTRQLLPLDSNAR